MDKAQNISISTIILSNAIYLRVQPHPPVTFHKKNFKNANINLDF
jgi:hypothetical protein